MENNKQIIEQVEDLTKINVGGFTYAAKALGTIDGKVSALTVIAGAAIGASIVGYIENRKKLKKIEMCLEEILDKE